MKEKGCIQLLQACITHCISISSQFTQKITGKVQKPILLIKAKICSVSMKYTNIHLCSLGVWSAQAFSQELKVSRPRSMFLVNYLKD